MTDLPPIPKDRNWSPETWRAGLDEASPPSLETQLQDLLIRKGIRQITVLEPDTMCPARFAVIRIGYPQRGVGATLSEAFDDCGVMVQ